MNLEMIPSAELSKYLNQVDLGNLTLTNKSINQIYQPYMNQIKDFFSTRASCLSIYLNRGDTHYEILYTYKNLSIDLIPPKNIIINVIDREIDIINYVITSIKILKNGDIIKFRNVHMFDKPIDYDKLDKIPYYSHIFSDSLVSNRDLHQYGMNAIHPKNQSIYHWCGLLNYFLLVSPYIIQSNANGYIEIDAGKFYYRVCFNDNGLLSNEPLFVTYENGKCITSPSFHLFPSR